jgi:hypothetical protein
VNKVIISAIDPAHPQVVEGPVFWIRVTTNPSANAQWRFDGGQWQTIDGFEALQAPDGGPHHLGGWKKIEVIGSLTVQVGTNPAQKFPGALNRPVEGTSTNDTDAIVQVGNAAVKIVAASTGRRSVFVQNLSTQVVYLSKDPGVVAALAAGNKILAVLAACAVAGDGTGGSISLDGWSGDLWAIVAAATSLVSVGAY